MRGEERMTTLTKSEERSDERVRFYSFSSPTHPRSVASLMASSMASSLRFSF